MNLVLWCFRGAGSGFIAVESVLLVRAARYRWAIAYAGELSSIDGLGVLFVLRHAYYGGNMTR